MQEKPKHRKIPFDPVRLRWHNWHWIPISKGPAKRLLRNHRKAVRAITIKLLAKGHRVRRWRYWYGASSVRCTRCANLYTVSLDGVLRERSITQCQDYMEVNDD